MNKTLIRAFAILVLAGLVLVSLIPLGLLSQTQ